MHMNININGLNIYYETEGEGKPMVFLHGWGGSTKSFEVFYNHYSKGFKVINLDLPGFGTSEEPEVSWDIEGYKEFLIAFFKSLNIIEPIIIGHSFGCRIVIKAAKELKFTQLILTGAAGIKPKRKLNYYMKVYSYKALKRLSRCPGIKGVIAPKMAHYKKNAGSSDYRNASSIMKGILSKAVNEDLSGYLPYINCPTLLIWGELGTATPLANGKTMEKLIPDAGLIVIDGATHFAYLEHAQRFLTIVDHFVEENRSKS